MKKVKKNKLAHTFALKLYFCFFWIVWIKSQVSKPIPTPGVISRQYFPSFDWRDNVLRVVNFISLVVFAKNS